MLKQHLTEILLASQWAFMFLFSVIGGVISNEAYLIVKNPNHKKWHNIFYKIIIGLFVCSLAHLFYVWKKWDLFYEYGFIALCGFMHFPLAGYIIKDLFPMLGKLTIDLINKGGKKDV
jgi:curved DNA-binding protein CbpA